MVSEQYRNGHYDKTSKYRRIEDMIIRREILWNENSSRKRRKTNTDMINNKEQDNNEEQDMTEQYLLALINGEETSTTVTE